MSVTLMLCSFIANSQILDTNFASPKLERAAEIWKFEQGSSGEIYLNGDIDFFGQEKTSRIIRINSAGEFDPSFKAELPSGFFPYEVESMPNGNLLVRNDREILMLSGRGKLLKSVTMTSAIGCVYALPNNTFLVSTWSGELFRFTKKGVLDKKFKNTSGVADGAITGIALQGSKLVVAGYFTQIRGISFNNIARLNSDGTVDSTFNPGTGTRDFIGGVVVQPDLKIIPVRTYINEFNGKYYQGGIRLNSDGSVDSTFNYPFYYHGPSEAYYVNDKITFGFFGTKIARTNADGSIDLSFQQIEQSNYIGLVMTILADNSLLLGNYIQTPYGVAKIDATGQQIPGITPPVGRQGLITSVIRSNEELVVGGDFFKINDLVTKNVARLSNLGIVDPTFQVQENFGNLFQIGVLPDRSVLISEYTHFFKVDQFGNRDFTFNFQQFDKLYQVEDFRTLDNGKIYVVGPNNNYRLNADGTEDVTYDVGSGIGGGVSTLYGYDVDRQSRPLYGGYFDSYQDEPIGRMLRINYDGTRDTSFDIGTGANNAVSALRIMGNDHIAVTGFFDEFNGVATPYRTVVVSQEGGVQTDFVANFQTEDFPFFVDIFSFGDKLLFSGFLNGRSVVLPYNLNGTSAPDFNFSAEVEGFDGLPQFYSSEADTLYVFGKIRMASGELRSSIIRVLYTTGLPNSPENMVQPNEVESNEVASKLNGEETDVKLYPVPVENTLTVDISDNANYLIYDFTGLKQKTGYLTKGGNELNLSFLKKGFYVLSIETGGKTKRYTFVKQ